jgi:hypothetical protein
MMMLLLLLLLLPLVTQSVQRMSTQRIDLAKGAAYVTLIFKLIFSNTLRSYVPARDYQVATRVSVMRMPCDVEVLFQL